ncbi:MAG: prepilin peptidase [Clostridiaceae bacterium]|nr:prepilin peptidase [Clostridiaceae bacterium]
MLGFCLWKVIKVNSLKINPKIEKETMWFYGYFIVGITSVAVLISFLKFGLSSLFIKAMILNCILIVVSFIDFQHQVIPNNMVIITLLSGILFTFLCDITIVNSLIGMFVGGGVLFLLALVPNVMGGGDIKWMFALGSFLGTQKVMVALFLAFIFAAVISILLLVFKIKGRKDHIPFGPFLALGCFASFHIIFLL